MKDFNSNRTTRFIDLVHEKNLNDDKNYSNRNYVAFFRSCLECKTSLKESWISRTKHELTNRQYDENHEYDRDFLWCCVDNDAKNIEQLFRNSFHENESVLSMKVIVVKRSPLIFSVDLNTGFLDCHRKKKSNKQSNWYAILIIHRKTLLGQKTVFHDRNRLIFWKLFEFRWFPIQVCILNIDFVFSDAEGVEKIHDYVFLQALYRVTIEILIVHLYFIDTRIY